MASLPSFIFTRWRLRQGEERKAKAARQFEDFTTSSLAEAYTKLQLHNHLATPDRSVSVPSLISLTVGSILHYLEISKTLAADVEIVAVSLSSTTLRQLLSDPRTPYYLLRKFLTLPATLVTKDRSMVDVDELVLQNERYMRTRDSNRDDKYLVTLDELSEILAKAPQNDGPLSFKRKDPPKGGLEILDGLRETDVTIQASSASFGEVFDRITGGALRGLDWSNVLVLGGMVLKTLLHTDPSKDNDKAVRDPDIDVCIYGLGPQDANRKVEEIHDIWVRNLPETAQARLVVKNACTINFIPSYPHRRIQIMLRLPPSPTDAFLRCDLDVCAIGFDGSRVLMLPRCARAIETGYSVFTMALIWGHRLSERRESKISRIFKYAGRGFGLRILPSYARSLEEDNLEAAVSKKFQSLAFIEGEARDEDDGEPWPKHKWRWIQRDRKPNGCSEPGLKTLKRIELLGQDFVRRFYYGATSLAISKGRYDRQRRLGHVDTAGAEHVINQEDEDEWRELFDETTRDLGGSFERPPPIRLTELETNEMDGISPNNRTGLENFEVFMRQCEAWKLHVDKQAFLVDLSRPASMDYDGDLYDNLPTYEWNEKFTIKKLEDKIEHCNNGLWAIVKKAVCKKLGIATRTSGYCGYSTRRIRLQVCSRDLAAVQEKQITMPVIVPWALEDYLLSKLPQQYGDLPSHFTNFKPLIPVHDASRDDPATRSLPSLQDTASESGNLRYWVITNESMWAGQHRALDEIAELIGLLFRWVAYNGWGMEIETDRPECKWHLARSFRNRTVLHEVPDHVSINMKFDIPSVREVLLFRQWAFSNPMLLNRQPVDDNDECHELFNDAWVLYPFPDDLFWQASDEGTWREPGVAPWTEPWTEPGPEMWTEPWWTDDTEWDSPESPEDMETELD